MPSNISFGVSFRKALSTFNLVTELGHAGSRIHKFSSTLLKVIGDAGRGRGHSNSTFYSVKLCVVINFSLQHNVLCLSFVVVLYSMYS